MIDVFPIHTDTNECEQELDVCHLNATCTDTDGSYVCECLSGFTGNGFHCSGKPLTYW